MSCRVYEVDKTPGPIPFLPKNGHHRMTKDNVACVVTMNCFYETVGSVVTVRSTWLSIVSDEFFFLSTFVQNSPTSLMVMHDDNALVCSLVFLLTRMQTVFFIMVLKGQA